jgi:CSLREA domain-containing protein
VLRRALEMRGRSPVRAGGTDSVDNDVARQLTASERIFRTEAPVASIRYTRLVLALAAALAISLTVPLPSDAATFTVNRTFDALDARPGDGICETARGNRICTLRAAIQEANARPGADTVTLPAGTYLTLPLDQNPAGSASGLEETGYLHITGSLTVLGAGRTKTIVKPAKRFSHRVFNINGLITVTIRGVTIRDGGNFFFGFGGGIHNVDATLTLNQTLLFGHFFANIGGGLFNERGTVHITKSQVDSSGGDLQAAGIVNRGGTIVVTESTIIRNSGDEDGAGGILNIGGTVLVVRSTIADNRAGDDGGGIANELGGLVIVTSSTLARNISFGTAGAISNREGTVILTNVTIADNESTVGTGGILSVSDDPSHRVTLHNSVLARNVSAFGRDCLGVITSLGYNVVGSVAGCTFMRGPFDIIGGDPGLGVFVESSAPGHGHIPLRPGSRAIERGLSATCPANDQLGQPRRDGDGSSGTQCDRGAVEFQP